VWGKKWNEKNGLPKGSHGTGKVSLVKQRNDSGRGSKTGPGGGKKNREFIFRGNHFGGAPKGDLMRIATLSKCYKEDTGTGSTGIFGIEKVMRGRRSRVIRGPRC